MDKGVKKIFNDVAERDVYKRQDMDIIDSLNEGDDVSVSGVPDNTSYLDW